jgi:hypothetical protein
MATSDKLITDAEKSDKNYEKENKAVEQKGFVEKYLHRWMELIMPSVPGALILFVFSAFFSSINFFSEVSDQSRSSIGVYRYLSIWILVNYLFALIILLLILPDPGDMENVNRTLLLYCLISTAIPELSANLRLQLGKSSRSLDLYKYKLKVSGLIAQKVSQANYERQSRKLISLALYYSNRMDQFNQKLRILMGQGDLTDEEKEGLKAFMEFVEDQSSHMTIEEAVSAVLVRYQSIIPKLLDFFHADIARFEHSPVSLLMKGLQPLLTVDEARRLVEAGIISPAGFSVRCSSESKRKQIAEKTGIALNRLTMLFFSSRNEYIHKRIRNIVWLSVVAFMVIISLVVLLHMTPERLGIGNWFEKGKIVTDKGALPEPGETKIELKERTDIKLSPSSKGGAAGGDSQ